MSETVRFQEVLRKLAMVDESFVTGQAGLGLGPAGTVALDSRTAALLQLAVWAGSSVPLPTWPPLWATTLRQRWKKPVTIDPFGRNSPDVQRRRPENPDFHADRMMRASNG
jgi:hypothetical protein